MTDLATADDTLARRLLADGFAFVPGASMRRQLEQHGTLDDWPSFAASWDTLAVDPYMVDRGRYRRRRHAVFVATADGAVQRAPSQAHWQALAYNALHGGIERWFEPISPEVAAGPTLRTVLRGAHALFSGLSPHVPRWHVEVHQFRIEALPGSAGLPTPEGVHRDGVDWVLVLLVRRRNIASGTTTVHAADGRLLGSFTLSEPFDAALVDDVRVHHGVTPVESLDGVAAAHRDVLVVTFQDAHRRATLRGAPDP